VDRRKRAARVGLLPTQDNGTALACLTPPFHRFRLRRPDSFTGDDARTHGESDGRTFLAVSQHGLGSFPDSVIPLRNIATLTAPVVHVPLRGIRHIHRCAVPPPTGKVAERSGGAHCWRRAVGLDSVDDPTTAIQEGVAGLRAPG
jgi:hypothetical protein